MRVPAGDVPGGGSSLKSDRDEVSLEDEELNRELNELDSFGKTEAGEYHQASFFDPEYGLAATTKQTSDYAEKAMEKLAKDQSEAKAGKYNYLYPKKEPDVPHEYIKQVVLRGTGFAGGRSRVCEIFHTEVDAGTRAKRIKQEYGQGGAGWPLEGYGLHGYDTFHGQGIRFQWRDEEGEKEGYVSWKNIEKEIGVLIMTGEYQPETPRFEDIDIEGIREDNEVIDGEYRELDAVSDADGIDDFAIPDEPESYNSSLSDIEKLNRAYNEGRPTEKAILTSRVIDRPIRPLFPKDMRNDCSVVCTVMSVDPDCSPEITAMIGTSIAISISDVPWNGPISGCSVGYIDGEFVINPTSEQKKISKMATTVEIISAQPFN